MAPEVSLRVADPRLAPLVRGWLADARLALPRSVTLSVDVAPLPLPPADDRTVFREGRVSIRSGPPVHTVTLDWEPRLGRAVLAPGSTHAHVVVAEAALDPGRENELLRSFLLDVMILLVRRVGLHHVHGAALVDPDGRGWLLAGSSGSGKSTTTALLGRAGWGVGTDDIAFLGAGESEGEVTVTCWRERIALREDAVAAAGSPAGGVVLGPRGKQGWFPEALAPRWTPRVTPQFLLFPSAEHPAVTTIAPLRPREAVTRLMRWSPWVALEADLADEHLALFTALARQGRAFDISLGRDLLANPGRLRELVA